MKNIRHLLQVSALLLSEFNSGFKANPNFPSTSGTMISVSL